MKVTVWSEQGEAKWRDCMQAAVLMLMVFGGVLAAKFRLGINTSAERERFEDAEGLSEADQEQGLVGYGRTDIASRALYGVVAHDAAEADLPGLLATPGLAIALTGNGAGLPPTPKYPSGFQGNHSITVLTSGGPTVGVLDPLQKSGTAAVPVAASTILAWHRRLTYGQDIRYVREDEFKEALMLKFRLAGGLGTLRLKTKAGGPAATLEEADKDISFFDLETGAFVKPTRPDFDACGSGTFGPEPANAQYNPGVVEGIWLVVDAGRNLAVLARNVIYTPAQEVGAQEAHAAGVAEEKADIRARLGI